MNRFFRTLVTRSPSTIMAGAVILLLGIQLAVRPDKWLGSYNLTAASINTYCAIVGGVLGALAAASGLVRGRQSFRALDPMSSRSFAFLDGLRFLACVTTISVAYIGVVAASFAASSTKDPGTRYGVSLLLAGWVTLIGVTGIGFGLGRLFPHPSCPPLVLVISTLFAGYGSSTGEFALPNYSAQQPQELLWRTLVAQSLFACGLVLLACVVGFVKTRTKWLDVTRLSQGSVISTGIAFALGLVVLSALIIPNSAEALAYSAPRSVCRSAEAVEVCVWDDRAEYVNRYLSMLTQTRGILHMQGKVRFAEFGLDRDPARRSFVVAGATTISFDQTSAASFGEATVAQGIALNWPKVRDSCGSEVQLDPTKLSRLLVVASRGTIEKPAAWRTDLRLDRPC
jgi:hypothetical protein